ncbi:hypothetical protein BCR44DRAFT_1490750 [Catenaria anguillulae PL171]|uniref:Uncharacterized protein n=1 Tax=Catenaria anguillulae PL171 TaxID=765915 RepID=A0A1Y2H450_9FUNG|nr:hypothetical protein BCR44DRAFT_1490750 [Catenaria anguillulae PL171]
MTSAASHARCGCCWRPGPRLPWPPSTPSTSASSARYADDDDQDLEFESTLDINISTLTSSLSAALSRLSAFTQPLHASDAATRRAAREVTYHFLRADAMGAMHVPLPPFWAGVIADLCEWVESTLAEQFAFSDSLYTEADRERVQHAARACALATAMMRVVHPQCRMRGCDRASGSIATRVAYCVFPKVDESETGLEEVGIWKAVVVGYVESDPTSQQQAQQQHPGPQKAPVPQPMMVAQGLPPRTSSKAPTPSNVPVEQHVSRSLPIAHVVAQQQLAQPPAPSAHLDSRALSVPTTVQQQQQQQQHHVVPAVVVHHQPTDALPAYFTLDHPAPISTTTSTTPIAPLDDHDDTDESAPANPLSLDYPDDDSNSDEQGVRARDQALVMSALHQDFVVQTSLDAASAAAAAAQRPWMEMPVPGISLHFLSFVHSFIHPQQTS